MNDPHDASAIRSDRRPGLWHRAREIVAGGPAVLTPLPSSAELTGLPEGERRRVLEGLRTDLYGISAIVADDVVRRASGARDGYPPYGLVRSMFSDFRVILDSPEPIGHEAINSFLTLGKGYIDTMVFHLHRELKEARKSERSWIVEHLERLVALFREHSDPAMRARMRDAFSFVYGGLHFGTSIAVQLTEVMARLLSSITGLTSSDRARIISRSNRPAYRLAAVNLDDVVVAYARLQPDEDGRGRPGTQSSPAGWMDSRRFAIEKVDGRPYRITFQDEAAIVGPPQGAEPNGSSPRFPTQGCPARVSPSGGTPAIGVLWTWGVELAQRAGLLDR